MARRQHVLISGTGTSFAYTSTATGSSKEFSYPARSRGQHARKLKADIERVQEQARQLVNSAPAGLEIRDIALEIFGAEGFDLTTNNLDNRNAKIELLSTRVEAGRKYATVYVPEDKISNFFRMIENYETKNDSRRRDGGPKNKDLVESMEGVRLPVVRSFWTDDPSRYPGDVNEQLWWEVWLRVGTSGEEEAFARFVQEANRAQLQVLDQRIRFPERVVFLARGSESQWAGSLSLLGLIAELRRAKELPTDFLSLTPAEQGDFVADAAARIQAPPADAPAVCLLDTGVNAGHPLLAPVLAADDLHAIHPDWSTADQKGHGTQMAGIATFGPSLAEHLASQGTHAPLHRLESVKLLHPSPTLFHQPENYGYVTIEAVSIAEQAKPQRPRVACLAVTADDRDVGYPSLWSAAIDQHASGHDDDVHRLYVVSTGNVRDLSAGQYEYPVTNRSACGVEDPGQAYNALTVGAYTDLAHVRSPEFAGRTPVASRGGLCPTSRTSMMWAAKEWPLKPDVVMEGGNYLQSTDGGVEACDDLSLLTTTVHPSGRLLDSMTDSSAATAQASKLAAELMSRYPTLWPETVRGLIIHSARWTDRMVQEFPDGTRESITQRLRCYGYGVPDLEAAAWSVDNATSLVVQDRLRPYARTASGIKTNECHFHDLPWPRQVLEDLGPLPITIRVTLSYFIEPSPARRGWTSKFRYPSHGLRFALRGPTESDPEFHKRISKSAWTDEESLSNDQRPVEVDRPGTGEPQRWAIGSQVRVRGSVHSDWWTGTAAEAAASGQLAVYPVTGWWKERSHLQRFDRDARYALIVTISTEDQTVDLYTPIATAAGIAVTTEIS